MCDIIPKTSENCAPLPTGGLQGVLCRDARASAAHGSCARGGSRKEGGGTPTTPNVRAHFTINLCELPSAPGAA